MVFQWILVQKPLQAMVFQWFLVTKTIGRIVFQWFPMVANHWSDVGMVTIHRSGLPDSQERRVCTAMCFQGSEAGSSRSSLQFFFDVL